MDLHLRRANLGPTEVLMITGEIDLATIPKLRGALLDMIVDAPATTIAVDLDGVTACDDMGFGVLLGAAGRAREADGDLVLVCTDERLLARIKRMRLDKAITVRARIF